MLAWQQLSVTTIGGHVTTLARQRLLVMPKCRPGSDCRPTAVGGQEVMETVAASFGQV